MQGEQTAVLSEEPEQKTPSNITPTKGTTHEATQLRESELVRLQKTIWRGEQRLHELERDWVLLQTKSMLLDAEVTKLENELKEAILD